jgi:hypothetical protein
MAAIPPSVSALKLGKRAKIHFPWTLLSFCPPAFASFMGEP